MVLADGKRTARSGAINILTVILTFIGVIVAIVALILERRQAESTRRQEESARETARRQEVGVAAWMRDLRDWASEAIDVLSEVVYASDDKQDPSSSDVRRYIPQLSALIDRGRFFLPNLLPNKDTRQDHSDKPRAFQGLRHGTLDP
jgi:hypothetical protein